MKVEPVYKSDLIVATSLLCAFCGDRNETCDKVTIKYFKKEGWVKVNDKVCCPDCYYNMTT